MSSSSTRRGAAHKALQAAHKAAPLLSTVAEPATTVSELQLAANRANAQLSCGPKTEQGKFKSSHNALKTGLTGRTILLPTDDVAAYQILVALIGEKFAPATDIEKHLVQSIADTEWRLLRIPTLESGLYALGRTELAAECVHESDPKIRATMLEALIFRTWQKDLRNLALQERRLRNQLKEDTAELRCLQQERLEKQTIAQKKQADTQPKTAPSEFGNGFEYSTLLMPAAPATPQTTQPPEIEQTLEAAA